MSFKIKRATVISIVLLLLVIATGKVAAQYDPDFNSTNCPYEQEQVNQIESAGGTITFTEYVDSTGDCNYGYTFNPGGGNNGGGGVTTLPGGNVLGSFGAPPARFSSTGLLLSCNFTPEQVSSGSVGSPRNNDTEYYLVINQSESCAWYRQTGPGLVPYSLMSYQQILTNPPAVCGGEVLAAVEVMGFGWNEFTQQWQRLPLVPDGHYVVCLNTDGTSQKMFSW